MATEIRPLVNDAMRTSRIDNYEVVELIVQVQNNVGVISIPDQPQIREAPIFALETYTVATMPVSPISGVALADNDQLKAGFLELYNAQYDEQGNPTGFKVGINRIPLISLVNQQNGTDPFVWQQKRFVGQQIVWQKSKIVFPVSQNFAAATAFVLGVYYPSWYQGSR